MDPTTTNVEERDLWKARITRALSELQSHTSHIDGRVMSDASDGEASSEPDNV